MTTRALRIVLLLALTSLGSSPGRADEALRATHDALFATFFPIDDPDLDPALRRAATGVRAGLLTLFSRTPALRAQLACLADPARLLRSLPPDARRALSADARPAVARFRASGLSSLDLAGRRALFDALTSSPHNALRRLAAQTRASYVFATYASPLRKLLTGVDEPLAVHPDLAGYLKANTPRLPAVPTLVHDAAGRRLRRRDGVAVDWVVVGSGPAGCVIAHELRRAGQRVVLVERGSFVVPGALATMGASPLMERGNRRRTADGAIIVRHGMAVGGGTTVNVDLAFSPLLPAIGRRIARWIDAGLLDARVYARSRIAAANAWVEHKVGTRVLAETEINANNRILWNGALARGITPSLYRLNRAPRGRGRSPVYDKRSAVEAFVLGPIAARDNPLTLLPDAEVTRVLLTRDKDGRPIAARGVELKIRAPWRHPAVLADPNRLALAPGATVTLAARNVVLCAGALGTPVVLTRSGLVSRWLGRGAVLHPSMPLGGIFDHPIGLLDGLTASVYVDHHALTDGYLLEAMGALPEYVAMMTPGDASAVLANVRRFGRAGGFGVMLVDSVSETNHLAIDPQTGRAELHYTLSEGDRRRFAKGVAESVRILFAAGAKEVFLPTTEDVKGDGGPARLTSAAQADLVAQRLRFVPNRTTVTSAHLQATARIGTTPAAGVVSPRLRVWALRGSELPNLYAMDASVLPSSVGANPMQAIYVLAKLFVDERLAEGRAKKN